MRWENFPQEEALSRDRQAAHQLNEGIAMRQFLIDVFRDILSTVIAEWIPQFIEWVCQMLWV